MKRILQTMALVLVLLTSACALPYPNQAPALGQGLPGPDGSVPLPTTAAGLASQNSSSDPNGGKVYLPGIIAGEAQPAAEAANPAAANPAAANPAAPDYPAPAVIDPTAPGATSTLEPSATASPEPSPTAADTATAEPAPDTIQRLAPYEPHTGEQTSYKDWQKWPVLPVVSQRAKEIYRQGLAAGNDPTRFSKIGDCQVIRQYFLGYFDNDNNDWHLGDNYSKYKDTLSQFHGSYFRLSMAVRTGFNVASVLSSINSDPKVCQAGETPLQCENRDWNPSIAIVSMETWTANRPTAAYEGYLRKIVDYLISQNVLPILATKADNLEGDNSINQMIARVAYEYDIPLWNFWAASYPLPSHGLLEDGFHLTNGDSLLVGDNLKLGWNMRNLTALQALDKVWKAVR